MRSLFIAGSGTQALCPLDMRSTTGATSPASCMCTHALCALMHAKGMSTEAGDVHCLHQYVKPLMCMCLCAHMSPELNAYELEDRSYGDGATGCCWLHKQNPNFLQEQYPGLTTDPSLQPSYAHHVKRCGHLVYFVCLVPRGKEGIRSPGTRVTH